MLLLFISISLFWQTLKSKDQLNVCSFWQKYRNLLRSTLVLPFNRNNVLLIRENSTGRFINILWRTEIANIFLHFYSIRNYLTLNQTHRHLHAHTHTHTHIQVTYHKFDLVQWFLETSLKMLWARKVLSCNNFEHASNTRQFISVFVFIVIFVGAHFEHILNSWLSLENYFYNNIYVYVLYMINIYYYSGWRLSHCSPVYRCLG